MAELADTSSHSPGGLTLAEMKAAAAQVGIDPALVERAARLLPADVTAAPSLMERLIGGRVRHTGEAHFPIVMDEARAAKLLSAVRIGVGRPGEGHSSAFGSTWRSSDDWGAVLSLTARADREGTSVTADLDRRGTLTVVAVLTSVVGFMALLFGGTVADELSPGFGAVGALFGVVGVLALARSYWGSTTRTARERLSRVMDCVSDFLIQEGNATSAGERAAAAGTEGDSART